MACVMGLVLDLSGVQYRGYVDKRWPAVKLTDSAPSGLWCFLKPEPRVPGLFMLKPVELGRWMIAAKESGNARRLRVAHRLIVSYNVKSAGRSNPEWKRVRRIFQQLRGARGVSEEELWQHALYFAKTPDERCRLSLQSARLALSLKRSEETPN
jgi:hypothetical protein